MPGSGKQTIEIHLLRERAYRALKEILVTGPRPPDPFLSARKLAKQLGMSNTPVRSAVERLEAEGFIIVSPQRGISVRELSDKEIADQYEIRGALEPYVVRQLAGRLALNQVERLRANLRVQESCSADGDLNRLIGLDTDFHLLLCEFLGNEEITRTLVQLRDKVHRVLLRIARHIPGRLTNSVPEHVQIAEAVVSGDAESAASYVLEHLDRGKQAILPRVSRV